jgi:hypothetical protein
VDVGVVLHFRPGEQILLHPSGQLEQRWIEALRRDRSEIHNVGLRLTGAVDDREADAAKPGVPRLHGGQSKCCRHRGVHGVTAGVQNRHAGLSRTFHLGDNDAAPAAGGRFREHPVLSEMRRRREMHCTLVRVRGI